MNTYKDSSAHPDVVDILGFLVYETVSKITKVSLLIKYKWEADDRGDLSHTQKQTCGPGNEHQNNSILSNMACNRSPLRPEHIHEAYRRLQYLAESPTLFRSSTTRKGLYFF